jgi:hypothetical protein
VFVEVTEPVRLTWVETASGMTSTATFLELDDGRTEVEIRQTNPPDSYRHPAARAGFVTSLDRFADYLTQQRST